MTRELATVQKDANDARCREWLEASQGRSTILATGVLPEEVEEKGDVEEAAPGTGAEASAVEAKQPKDEHKQPGGGGAAVAGFTGGTNPSILESALMELKKRVVELENQLEQSSAEAAYDMTTLRAQLEGEKREVEDKLRAQANASDKLKAELDAAIAEAAGKEEEVNVLRRYHETQMTCTLQQVIGGPPAFSCTFPWCLCHALPFYTPRQ